MILAILGGIAGASTGTPAFAQDRPGSPAPIPHGQDRAPNAPRSPAEAIRAMTVPHGFRVELVAAEPDLVNPVAMTFDERGRIWITESLEYPRRSPGPGRDRVKVLEDTDGDGKADKFSIFAEGLNIPSGIAVGHGGVWVANSPDILFLQDRDGDGKADTKEVVATGFGRSDTHELPNSLTWGPDGWLYGWNGVFNPARVVSKNGKTYEFTCAIFRIHPKTRVFEVWCEGTSNPWGIAIDTEGSFFSSACVIDHLWHLVETGYYIRQGGPYPPYTWPIESIVDHNHQKAAYCGIHYFDSPAYPPEYRGRLYMGNIHGNCINVDTLVRYGSTYRAKAAPDFLQANDSWFMPVAQKTGPDGCLYILDWYDQYHCYQDANRDPAGIDRLKGRLYRVRYMESPRRFGFDLARSSDDELIDFLRDPNVYVRDIAQRLLTERASPALRGKLETLVMDDQAPRQARLHGLWALIASGPLEVGFHLKLLNDPRQSFQAWAVRAAGNQGRVESSIRDRVRDLAGNSSPEVRLQAAIAARKLKDVDPVPILMDALLNASDPLIPQIVWQNLHPLLEERQLDVTRRLKEHRGTDLAISALAPRAIERLLDSPKASPELVRVLQGRMKGKEDLRQTIDVLAERFRARSLSPEMEKSLHEELTRLLSNMAPDAGDDSPALEYRILLAYCGDQASLKKTWEIARMAWKGEEPESRDDWEESRIRAVGAVLHRKIQGSMRSLVASILAEDDAMSSLDFRGSVLDALDAIDDPEVAPVVLKAYGQLPASLKPRAIELLTRRPAWTRALLAAVADKQVPATVLNVTQLRKLQQSKDPEIAGRIKAVWGTIREGRNPQRERLVERIRRSIRSTPGDPVAGTAVFNKLCVQCHKIHGAGQEVGPDLTSNGRNDFDQLVSNVFDPSLVIGPGYQATTLATTDGRVLTGLLAESGKDRIVLKLQGGKLETVPRNQVDEMKTAEVSLMPEEIEKQLSPQEIADLFAFLCLDKPPSDPTAKPLPGAGPIKKRP
jgi:putative membrane-bound dehydrogenase-like protein